MPVDMHRGLGEVRQEIAQFRVEILKWMTVLWIGNLSAMAGLFAVVLRGR